MPQVGQGELLSIFFDIPVELPRLYFFVSDTIVFVRVWLRCKLSLVSPDVSISLFALVDEFS